MVVASKTDMVQALDITIGNLLDTFLEGVVEVGIRLNLEHADIIAACFEYGDDLGHWVQDHIAEQEVLGNL